MQMNTRTANIVLWVVTAALLIGLGPWEIEAFSYTPVVLVLAFAYVLIDLFRPSKETIKNICAITGGVAVISALALLAWHYKIFENVKVIG